MDDFSFMSKMNDEEAYLFKRSIRKLLDATFLVADKDERLYDFISAESNQYDVNTYLSAIGYKVVVEERMGVAMLQQNDEDIETVGLKRINLFRFDTKQIKLLMALWLLFLERMGYTDPVHVTVGDIIDKCRIYQISMTPGEFKNAYRVFKRFSLIDYSDDITSEDGKVRLYPTLQFCMDIGELKQVMAEYVPDDTDAKAHESASMWGAGQEIWEPDRDAGEIKAYGENGEIERQAVKMDPVGQTAGIEPDEGAVESSWEYGLESEDTNE